MKLCRLKAIKYDPVVKSIKEKKSNLETHLMLKQLKSSFYCVCHHKWKFSLFLPEIALDVIKAMG